MDRSLTSTGSQGASWQGHDKMEPLGATLHDSLVALHATTVTMGPRNSTPRDLPKRRENPCPDGDVNVDSRIIRNAQEMGAAHVG